MQLSLSCILLNSEIEMMSDVHDWCISLQRSNRLKNNWDMRAARMYLLVLFQLSLDFVITLLLSSSVHSIGPAGKGFHILSFSSHARTNSRRSKAGSLPLLGSVGELVKTCSLDTN